MRITAVLLLGFMLAACSKKPQAVPPASQAEVAAAPAKARDEIQPIVIPPEEADPKTDEEEPSAPDSTPPPP